MLGCIVTDYLCLKKSITVSHGAGEKLGHPMYDEGRPAHLLTIFLFLSFIKVIFSATLVLNGYEQG